MTLGSYLGGVVGQRRGCRGGRRDRLMGIWMELLWVIFPGSLGTQGRRERGLYVFKMREP